MSRLAVLLAGLLACLLAVFGCRRAAEAPAAAPAAQVDESLRLENENLLNLVFGASVIERDNELHFESSAAHAIDGTAMTPWQSASGGPLTAIYSLGAPARLERLGAAMPQSKTMPPARLRVETSLDGASWQRALDLEVRYHTGAPQLGDVRPVVARYLRVTLDTPVHDKAVMSLWAIGRETAPATQPSLEGCWQINGQRARFMKRGARVAGVIGNMAVDGGSDGRVYRLMWLGGPMWGYAAVTVSPDGQRLGGVRWHEEVNPKYAGDGWLGQRVPCGANEAVADARIVDALIGRTGMWRLYGIRFDGQDRIVASESAGALDLAARLVRDHPEHRFRVIARDFRPSSQAHCAAKLAAVRAALQARGTDLARVEFVSAGTQRHELGVDFTTQRVMDTAVDLQVLPR